MSRSLILKLASIHPDNRAWILKQLNEDERNTIMPLLNEAMELGLHENTHLIDTAISELKTEEATPILNSPSINAEKISKMHSFWQSLYFASLDDKEQASLALNHGLSNIRCNTDSPTPQKLLKAISEEME